MVTGAITSPAESLRLSLFRENLSREELRALKGELWRLAWPVFIAQGMSQAVVLASRVMVNSLGEEVLAAVGVGQMIFFALIVLLGAVGMGVTALVARHVGAGEREQASEVLKQSLIVGSLFSGVIAVAGILTARPLLRALGSAPAVVEYGAQYIITLYFGLIPMALGFFIGAGLRGAGDTRTPMVISIFMNVINVLACYTLVFGKFGFPPMGVTGAALAMNLAFILATVVLFLLFPLKLSVLPMRLRGWKIRREVAWRIFRIGTPTAAEWELLQVGLVLYIAIVNHYGTSTTAAYIIGMTVLSFAQLPGFGLQAAATTLVGQSLGANNIPRAEATFRQSLRWSLSWMTLLGVATFFLSGWLVRTLFPNDNPETYRLATLYLQLIAVTQPLMGIAFAISGGLRGAGDTTWPLIGQATGMYVGRIGLSFVAMRYFNAPVGLIWAMMFPDFIIRIVIVTSRLLSGKWKIIRV